MFLRVGLFLMMAIGLAGLGAVAWIGTSHPQAEAAAPVVPKGPGIVLVAAQPLRAGALIKPEDITAKELKTGDAADGFSADTPANREALVGAMLKRAIGKEEALMARDVMRPTEHGFLAAVVGQGMRAVTIGVDAVSGTAGLISPGDRVDVILAQTIDDAALPIGRRFAAETVLINARVVAIDQQIIQGNRDPGTGGHTVTLEVTGEQAERLTVATRIGKLSLTVRSADVAAGVPSGLSSTPIFASDVSRALSGQAAKRSTGSTLKIHSGNGDTREFRF
jgi:pilus assembly protein CpaB